jgi:hypothetical protein
LRLDVWGESTGHLVFAQTSDFNLKLQTTISKLNLPLFASIMKIASINEIKQELTHASQKELLALCLQLAKFKKENKELLSFLLFEAHDLQGYIQNVKKEVDEQFIGINRSNLYYAKKSLRKILRIINKYIRHTGSKEAEVEIRLHYCQSMKGSGIRIDKSNTLKNLYQGQIKKIKAAIETFHEDLAYEYLKQVERLSS